MAGLAILADLLRKNSVSQSLNSHSARIVFSASAAASIAATKPFAYRAFFGNERGRPRVAYCDAAAAETFSQEDYLSTIGAISESILKYESKPLMQKEYYVELKPLWYAFELKQFVVMSLRAFLLHYLPLLESHTNAEEDDDDVFPDNQESKKVDLVTPFKKSLLQIVRETSIVTTRRVLERVTLLHVSQRTAWKLLKDASKSALRKSQRGFPTYLYIFRVGRTTFRTHLLMVASQWLVDVITETCKFFRSSSSDIDIDTKREPARHLVKKVVGATIRGGGSLIFAPIGAAIFATIIRPSLGQWIGCIIGDLVGPIIVVYILEKNNLEF